MARKATVAKGTGRTAEAFRLAADHFSMCPTCSLATGTKLVESRIPCDEGLRLRADWKRYEEEDM